MEATVTKTTTDLVAELRRRIDEEPGTLDRIIEQLKTRSSGVKRQTLGDLMSEGDLAGYRRGYPPSWRFDASKRESQADGDVACADSPCAHCGHRGLRCIAFHNDRGHRTFAECPACSHCEDF